MNVVEIAQMRRLQRKYREELSKSVRCKHSSKVLFLYRLSVAFSLGIFTAFFIHHL
jgi:hypothetical protein